MSFPAAMVLALLIDVAVGWPEWLYARIGHPVTWIGRMISLGESSLNRGKSRFRKGSGAVLAVLTLAIAGCVAWSVASVLPGGWSGVVLTGLLAWPFVAALSLRDHVAAVGAPLAEGDLDGARRAVSMIVGRNPESMDEGAIARAALESLAENASDGVIAPMFWGAIFGLPGIAAYKALNTLDSMIGHRNARYRDFGWASARLDDLANLVPARLTGVLISVVARGSCGPAFRTMLRDAGRHRSPNAGWPEAAMAGALGVRLSGPRLYDGLPSEDPWLNAGAPDPGARDIARGLALFWRTVFAFGVGLFLVSMV